MFQKGTYLLACCMRPGVAARSVNLGSLKEDCGSVLKHLQLVQLDNGYQAGPGSTGGSFKCWQRDGVLPFYAASP